MRIFAWNVVRDAKMAAPTNTEDCRPSGATVFTGERERESARARERERERERERDYYLLGPIERIY